jgi:hypothetical protein
VNSGSVPSAFFSFAADRRRAPVLPDDGVVDRLARGRSQTTVVSRWLVMPMAAMSRAVTGLAQRLLAGGDNVDQISSGSCSTQPDAG